MVATKNEYVNESIFERSFEYGKFLIDLTVGIAFDSLEHLSARFEIEDFDDPFTQDIFVK